MFFYSFAYSEDFNLICEGERKVHNLSGKEFNVTDFESVLLKINNNSMEYIGVNSGRSFFSAIGNIRLPKDHLTKISKLQSIMNTHQKQLKLHRR